MKEVELSLYDIEQHFNAISNFGNLKNTDGNGFWRPGWSDDESAAFHYFQSQAEQNGLEWKFDDVGNLFIRKGTAIPCIQFGSHLDTVYQGGNYDGVAGIVAGFEVIRLWNEPRFFQELSLELVIWRGEESDSYGVACKGSKAAFGMLESKYLNATLHGVTLHQAIEDQGFSAASISAGRALYTQNDIDSIQAHIELHIEQSSQLHSESIAVCTSIRGPVRIRLSCYGRADHSGATPMGPKHRSDANLALAKAIVAADRLAMDFLKHGRDLVCTSGIINSLAHSPDLKKQLSNIGITKVSPFSYCIFDIRSDSETTKHDYLRTLEQELNYLAEENNVEISFELLSQGPAVELLDATLGEALYTAAQAINIPVISIPCGAGHDAAVIAKQTYSDGSLLPVGLILIPCRNGVSHHPEEYAEPQAVLNGILVLLQFLRSFLK